jgi:hypothetical protein
VPNMNVLTLVGSGVVISHRRHEKSCFAGAHDGLGKEANQYLRRQVAAHDLDIENAEQWCKLCATGRIGKPLHPEKAHGDFAPNRHLYLYYSEESLALVRFDAEQLKDIKKFRHQVGRGAIEGEGMVTPLRVRCQWCGCAGNEQDCPHLPEVSVLQCLHVRMMCVDAGLARDSHPMSALVAPASESLCTAVGHGGGAAGC